ncbi:MAG TPA: tyrosine--tRNA ligase, partial [Candidatus Nanoarchaeia archaeon]|nr:tyrosine--tRNA ligase [Candidatus Nanoarchaeia archaeon]
QWAKLFVFNINKELTIERQKKYGGTIHFDNYEELEKLYAEGKLHPQDLKSGVAESLVETLAPVRKYFENPKHHKLLEQLEKITRGTKL